MKNWLKAVNKARSRISTQLYLTIGGAVVLTLSASLVGWFLLNRVGEVQQVVNEGSVPDLAAAFGVAQYSSVLVAAAPRLASAATPEDYGAVLVSIGEAHAAFEVQLAVLEGRDEGEARFTRIRAHSDTLISNIRAISDEVAASFEHVERREALRRELEELRVRLNDIIVPAIDDQLFYTMTGYRDLGSPPEPRSETLLGERVRPLSVSGRASGRCDVVDATVGERFHALRSVAGGTLAGALRGRGQPNRA